MDNEPQPEGAHPVLLYVDTLRARMSAEEFGLLMRMIRPTLAAISAHETGTIDIDLGEDDAKVTPALRDEVATVITIALTGRMDQQFVQVDVDDAGHPVRAMVDAETADDPAKLQELREWARSRRAEDSELRGIAEASGMDDDHP